MLINEIFTSIDGESKRAGELATFIRVNYCNLKCEWCDSKYTWHKEDTSKEMAIDEIVAKCKEFNIQNITFTGGEPLLQKEADELIDNLTKEGFDVSIETNGSVDFTNRKWFVNNNPYVWICVDYKCPSSNETSKMLSLDKFVQLREQDVIKFVVGTDEDLNEALKVITYIRSKNCECYVYLSPVFGSIELPTIIEFMQKHNLQNKIRFQLQLHKFIWDPEKRGV